MMKSDKKNNFNVKYKGEILIIKKNKNTGKVAQEHKQHNLFLLNGRKKILNQLGSSGCYARIVLSTSTAVESLTATSIPATILWADSTGTPTFVSEESGLSITKRMTVTVESPPLGTSRSIGTIGIANNVNGSGAICYTKLTDVITQADDETLYIYYSIILSANS